MNKNRKREKLSDSYNFAVCYPNLAREWHPTKNGDIKPEKIFPNTSQKVWWICDKGHEWQAWTSTRINNGDCPYCSNKRVSEKHNLQVLNPSIAAEWHPTKNGDLKPTDVMPGTKKKVWWLCECGREWQAQISNRSRGKSGCRSCAAKRSSKATNLLVSYPELCKEWHPTKNLGLTSEEVLSSSTQKVWWMCGKGHEWETQVTSRARRDGITGCPECNNQMVYGRTFATESPHLVQEWHPTKNVDYFPGDVSPKSNRKVWWKCNKGHEWKASIKYRANGGGCPYCSGKRVTAENCLATKNPDLAKEWHNSKNGELTPHDVTWSSGKKIWWICSRGHEWKAKISNRANGTGCPKCSPNTSLNEITILCELKSVFQEVQWHQRIDGKEADVFIPEYNVAIEYDGYHWHKDKKVLDMDKTEAFAKLGITTFRVREAGLSALSERDITHVAKERNFKLVKNLLEVMQSYLDLNPETMNKINTYIERKKLVNGAMYRKMVSCLPGPQPENSLSELFPTVALEWDSEKNFPLEPSMFAGRSSVKVWWRCDKGHSWQTAISGRTGGTGCPVCAGRTPSSDYNLAIVYPEIAKQWHPTKNGDLKPGKTVPGSNKKVWWECEKGHEWQVSPSARISGTGCPYCGNRAVGNDNNLAVVFPDLEKQWHPTKNRDLKPEEMLPGSNKKVWWECEKGHEWQVSPNVRISGTGCPYCSNRAVGRDNNLAVMFPDLEKEWHLTKNANLTPYDIIPGSHKKVWWMCEKGHEWKAVVLTRSNGVGCPFCSGRLASKENNLYEKFPNVTAEWHTIKNGELTPRDVTPKSNKKVWWMCEKGHEWKARVADRANGSGCPDCTNSRLSKKNCLATRNPKLASEWHPIENGELKPTEVTLYSHRKVWWLCEQGHTWLAKVQARANGNGCPTCRKQRGRKKRLPI